MSNPPSTLMIHFIFSESEYFTQVFSSHESCGDFEDFQVFTKIENFRFCHSEQAKHHANPTPGACLPIKKDLSIGGETKGWYIEASRWSSKQ
jgi:hypothetical protein